MHGLVSGKVGGTGKAWAFVRVHVEGLGFLHSYKCQRGIRRVRRESIHLEYYNGMC